MSSYNNHHHHSEAFTYGFPPQTPYHYLSGRSFQRASVYSRIYDDDKSAIFDGSPLTGDESNFWSSSPRSDSPSPNSNMQNALVGNYFFADTNRPLADDRHTQFRNVYQPNAPAIETGAPHHIEVPFVRVIKRRTTANKKERRRTQSINNAYADLRDCIPNLPPDTKLSKIKTLRLAKSYINYLVKALESDDPACGFTAELGSISRKSTNNSAMHVDGSVGQISPKSDVSEDMNKARKAKGRTGWPQHVWALELEQDLAL